MNQEPTLSVSLTAKEGAKALAFYQQAFGVEVIDRYDTPAGGLGHATLRVGDTTFYLSDESDEYQAFGFAGGAMSPSLLCLQVPNCDAGYERAVAAGARSLFGPRDSDWGSRAALVVDPFGYRWCIAHKLAR
ncbi:MAG: VOC family protein [Verrucomicrobia bacterium]|nr:VOC family protein [Verrucomicrobiota bacterium]